jgi:hypothetical protein
MHHHLLIRMVHHMHQVVDGGPSFLLAARQMKMVTVLILLELFVVEIR